MSKLKRKRPKAQASKREPGDILRYLTNVRTPPKRKRGEILCHNHVKHLAGAGSGINGFRYFICDGRQGHGWKLCPCGWRSDFGKHYALPDHVAYQRKCIAAGEPLTMYWDPGYPPPPGFKRVGRNLIAQQN
jgi:hypothetical protein